MEVEEYKAKWDISLKILALAPITLVFNSVDYKKIDCEDRRQHQGEPQLCFACRYVFTPEDYIRQLTDYKFQEFLEIMLGELWNEFRLNGRGNKYMKAYIKDSPHFNPSAPEVKQWPYLRGLVDMQVVHAMHAQMH